MQDVMKTVSSQMALCDQFYKKILSIFLFFKKNLNPNPNQTLKLKPKLNPNPNPNPKFQLKL
jgi:hypothetical protein